MLFRTFLGQSLCCKHLQHVLQIPSCMLSCMYNDSQQTLVAITTRPNPLNRIGGSQKIDTVMEATVRSLRFYRYQNIKKQLNSMLYIVK